MTLAPAAVELVKRFEGLRLTAYRCPAGVLTIGYGRTANVRPGSRITAEDAEWLLMADLKDVANRLRPLLDVELTPNQFGALVSFCFNVGIGAFSRSTLRKLVNAGRFAEVPAELAKWTRGGGKVLPGLVRRRAAEAELWNAAP